MSNIANCIIKTSIYPDSLKLGKIIPIFKKGNSEDPSNYRPICLLSAINKIVEKVLYKRLYGFFEKHGLIFNYQFGFRQAYSTTLALIEITDEIRKEIEKRNITIGIYLDLTKAFDLVDHKILEYKLNRYGVRGSVLSLIKSYLMNRQQYTKINGVKSSISGNICGVPQGSVLGPLFFLVYLNDIQYCTNAKLRLYADDTNVFVTDKSPQVVKFKAEKCMQDIAEWLGANKLVLSQGKTKYSVFMPISKKIPTCLNSIKIDNTIVHRSTSCKYLGIHLDDKVRFDEHIRQLSKSLVKTISAFKIIKNWIPDGLKLQLYFAYFHSKLQYGLEVYGSAAQKYIKQLEVLQHRALKTLFNLDPLTPSLPLLHRFKILTVHDLYKVKISQFMHKQRTGKLPDMFSHYANDLSDDKSYPNTRNRMKLYIPRMRTELGKRSIRYMGVKLWNELIDVLDYECFTKSEAVLVYRVRQYYLSKYVYN